MKKTKKLNSWMKGLTIASFLCALIGAGFYGFSVYKISQIENTQFHQRMLPILVDIILVLVVPTMLFLLVMWKVKDLNTGIVMTASSTLLLVLITVNGLCLNYCDSWIDTVKKIGMSDYFRYVPWRVFLKGETTAFIKYTKGFFEMNSSVPDAWRSYWGAMGAHVGEYFQLLSLVLAIAAGILMIINAKKAKKVSQ